MKVALIQLSAGSDKNSNVRKAVEMTETALQQGAKLVALPEVFNFRGNTQDPQITAAAAERVPGASLLPFMALAKKYTAAVLAGSIFEKGPQGKVFNCSVFIDPAGTPLAKYRKINLFDARLGDKIIKESLCFHPGKLITTVPHEEFKLGLSICYDLRFAPLYGELASRGANFLMVPSCFTKKTGEFHWEVLLRARAIENLSYVIAPNQVGVDFRGVEAYGNSMIVSPWGEVVARASGNKEEILYGEIDLQKIEQARQILPKINSVKGQRL
jgi:predicted amidohydrolase